MIAILLAAQMAAQAGPPPPISPTLGLLQPRRGELIQVLPASRANCFGGSGRLEVSFAEPTALYRDGDRPARGLRRWADYPNGALCRVEASR